tara:strand:- start:544 stop:1143 length:600 start_codon:yes stop_codon:yes gene_type:complete
MSFSKIISTILHPVFMPLIAIYLSLELVAEAGLVTNTVGVFYIIVFLSTVAIPLTSVLFLKKIKHISSLEMRDHKERSLPLLITAFSMTIGYYWLNDILIFFPLLRNEILGAIFLIIFASIVSRYWKISLHMLGVGGVIGVLFSLNILFGNLSNLLIIFILTSGLLGYARLKEKAHSSTQVYLGFLIGFLIEFFCVLLL